MDTNLKLQTGLYGAQTTAEQATTPVERRKNPFLNQLALTKGAYISLVLFMIVYCARPEDWIPGLSVIPLAKIVGLFALIGFLLCLGQLGRGFPPEVVCLLLLIVQLFATVPFSPVWKGGAFMHSVDFAKVGFIILVMAVAVTSPKRLTQLLYIQAGSVAIVTLVTLIKGRVRFGRLEGVLNGNYSNSNDLALAIVMSLPLCLAFLFLTKNPASKVLWSVAVLIMTAGVIRTGSRAGLIALLIGGGICLWEFAFRHRQYYLLPLAGFACVVLLVFFGGTLSERMHATFDSQSTDVSAYGSAEQRRQLLWQSILITAKHPIFGVGPGNFAEVSGSWHESHNSYTQMSSECGIPALAFYLTILWCGFKNLRSVKKLPLKSKRLDILRICLRASLAGFVVGSFFASVAYHFFPYFAVAYTTALLQIAKNSLYQARYLEAAAVPTTI